MSRRYAREAAFKTLFQKEQGGIELDKALNFCFDELDLSDNDKTFARMLVEGTLSNLNNIDEVVSKFLVNWELKRLATVDRAVLRLAIYELLYQTDIPSAVTINEAIEITKKYQDEESAAFVNGLLDKITKDIPAGIKSGESI